MYHRIRTPPPSHQRVVLTEVRCVVVTGPSLYLRVALHAVEAVAIADTPPYLSKNMFSVYEFLETHVGFLLCPVKKRNGRLSVSRVAVVSATALTRRIKFRLCVFKPLSFRVIQSIFHLAIRFNDLRKVFPVPRFLGLLTERRNGIT